MQVFFEIFSYFFMNNNIIYDNNIFADKSVVFAFAT